MPVLGRRISMSSLRLVTLAFAVTSCVALLPFPFSSGALANDPTEPSVSSTNHPCEGLTSAPFTISSDALKQGETQIFSAIAPSEACSFSLRAVANSEPPRPGSTCVVTPVFTPIPYDGKGLQATLHESGECIWLRMDHWIEVSALPNKSIEPPEMPTLQNIPGTGTAYGGAKRVTARVTGYDAVGLKLWSASKTADWSYSADSVSNIRAWSEYDWGPLGTTYWRLEYRLSNTEVYSYWFWTYHLVWFYSDGFPLPFDVLPDPLPDTDFVGQPSVQAWYQGNYRCYFFPRPGYATGRFEGFPYYLEYKQECVLELES